MSVLIRDHGYTEAVLDMLPWEFEIVTMLAVQHNKEQKNK